MLCCIEYEFKRMSISVKNPNWKNGLAIVGLISCTALLAGCTTSRFVGAPLITNSVNTANNADLNQAMPSAVAATDLPSARQNLSAGNGAPYIPAADVGGNATYNTTYNSQDPRLMGQNGQVQATPIYGQPLASAPSVARQQLPTLSSPQVTSTQQMPAMPSVAEVDLTKAPSIDQSSTASIAQTPRAVPDNAFTHKIQSGESLYAIARRYEVTTDALVSANGLASPDKIFVGQNIIVPGRQGAPQSQPAPTTNLAAAPKPLGTLKTSTATQAMPAPVTPAATAPVEIDETPTASIAMSASSTPQVAPTPIRRPAGLSAPRPAQTTPQPQVQTPVVAETKPEPKVEAKPVETKVAAVTPAPKVTARPQPAAASQGFRWPVNGRVIADFKASKNTGLNIEVPEGSSVRAAEAGEVIYVGSAVEGFGNLILIKHANGYVSAYAHLKDINVAKGTQVNRGDSIGTVGMTGAVNRPQLHFELRKGATPVDPTPLLSS
jgi:murein DD-endopeptidase MepM/ murein hydrolase activator NlpD